MSKKDLIPFEKGQSGNPNGRPKGSRNRSTIAREMLALLSKHKDDQGIESELSNEEIMTLKQIKKAIDDQDTNAYKAVLDSAYGAPKQEIDQKNTEVKPPSIKFSDSASDE